MGLCGSTVEVQTRDDLVGVIPGSGGQTGPKPSNRSRIALKIDDDDGLSPRPQGEKKVSPTGKQNDRKMESFPEETNTNTAHGAEEGDGNGNVRVDVIEVKEGDGGVSKSFKAASLTRKGFIPYHNIDNQDAELIVTGLQDDPNISLFAVMDGHGEFGGEVSQYVREHFPYHLAAQLDLKADPAFAIAKGVKDTTIALQRSRQIDLSFSGCTLCFVLKIGATLFIGNIGEARCVLARVLRFDDSYEVDLDPVGLSLEHVPDNEMEALRIQKMGGRIKPMDVPPGEHPGPNRIWLKEAEAPGLTVSRAIGDEVAQTVGVISVPEVRQYDVDEDDLFFVIATDGLWKFMSNMEVVVICQRYSDDLSSACKHLAREARKRWQAREEVVDDITVVVVKLNDSNLTFKSVAAYKDKDKGKDKEKDKKDKKKRK